jgi:hypothetical protein
MISRRTFTAAAGVAIAGLLSRIRFAPSAPRRRLGRRFAWGDFTFEINPEFMGGFTVEFRGEDLCARRTGPYTIYDNAYLKSRQQHGAIEIACRLRDDGHIGLDRVQIATVDDREAAMTIGTIHVAPPFPGAGKDLVVLESMLPASVFYDFDANGGAGGWKPFV